MQMIMDMWRVDPALCGLSGLSTIPATGLVGYLVAAPVEEEPFLKNGRFDIDAFEDASVGVFFSLTREGFRAAHAQLRGRCRRLGHVLLRVA